ncbi:hypothetical protein PUN28_019621 [Cardiocondyla obscurior]|uniref:Uncharacterized protein n=1 Tax=Cardiocondyla obscurior TaxID=286306 RepID=A0AAW2EDE3_9HYME
MYVRHERRSIFANKRDRGRRNARENGARSTSKRGVVSLTKLRESEFAVSNPSPFHACNYTCSIFSTKRPTQADEIILCSKYSTCRCARCRLGFSRREVSSTECEAERIRARQHAGGSRTAWYFKRCQGDHVDGARRSQSRAPLHPLHQPITFVRCR